MPLSLIDVDALEAAASKQFDSCPLQEALLFQARAFELAAWVPANLDTLVTYAVDMMVSHAFSVPLALLAELQKYSIANMIANAQAQAMARIQMAIDFFTNIGAAFDNMKAAQEAMIAWLFSLPAKILGEHMAQAEAAWDIILNYTPYGWLIDGYLNQLGFVFTSLPVNIPVMFNLLGEKSIVAAMYNPQYNPLAWYGDYYASVADEGYARIPFEAPQDIFYSIIPWAYQLLWQTLIYTWDPVFYYSLKLPRNWMAIAKEYEGSINPYQIQKTYFKTMFDFDATCPDVQSRIMPKMMKVGLALPAWLIYIVLFIIRFFLVIGFAIAVAFAWVFDFIYGIILAIQHFFIFYIIMPIFNFFMYINMIILWILNIPWMIIQLTIRFIWVIYMIIFNIIWSIMWPIISFFIWLNWIIPYTIWTYIIYPIFLFIVWLQWIMWEIMIFIPKMIWMYIIWPIFQILLFIPQWIWLNITLPIINFFIWFQLWLHLNIFMPIVNFFWWLVFLIPNLIIEFILKPLWFLLYWLAGFLCMIIMFIPKWLFFNIFIPLLRFFIWLELMIWLYIIWPIIQFLIYLPWLIIQFFIWLAFTIMFYIKLIIQLILWPFDWLCATLWGIIDMILDVIIALGEVPAWQPMFGNSPLAGLILFANELA